MGKIYRAMQEGGDGLPMSGSTARTLGVRPHIDIPVSNGQVSPGTGGLSAAPDVPLHLPKHRRPPELSGTGKDAVWELDTTALEEDLQWVPDSMIHGTIQPSRTMSLDEFQRCWKIRPLTGSRYLGQSHENAS